MSGTVQWIEIHDCYLQGVFQESQGIRPITSWYGYSEGVQMDVKVTCFQSATQQVRGHFLEVTLGVAAS